MSKVVLLALNAKYVHSALSVWYLAKAVSLYSAVPHDVSVVESNVNRPVQEIADNVLAFNPDVVGLSIYIWNAEIMKCVMKALMPDIIFVAGGPEASFNPLYWLDQGADYVINGEGERAFPSLLDRLSRKEKCEKVCSLPFEELWPDPYNKRYFDMLGAKIAYLETSRGCPFCCEFCLSGESNVRFLPLDIAKQRLYKLSMSGARTIKLVDRTFNCNSQRAYKLFEYVIQLNTNCCFHFEVAADLFDDKTLHLLSNAIPGRIQIEAGLQSFNKITLENVSRQTDLDRVEENISALLQNGNVHVHIDLIAGLPYENLNSFKESFNRAYSIGAHKLQLGFLKLLHGTVLRNKAQSMNMAFDHNPPYEITSTQWLGEEDLKIIKQTESALENTYNKGRFLSAIQYLLSASLIRPFDFFFNLGKAVTEKSCGPEKYAEEIYNYGVKCLGVDQSKLIDRLIRDWLASMKGKNMPEFLKIKSGHRKRMLENASEMLGYKIDRDCLAVISDDKFVFVNSARRNIVTGLYELHTALLI